MPCVDFYLARHIQKLKFMMLLLLSEKARGCRVDVSYLRRISASVRKRSRFRKIDPPVPLRRVGVLSYFERGSSASASSYRGEIRKRFHSGHQLCIKVPCSSWAVENLSSKQIDHSRLFSLRSKNDRLCLANFCLLLDLPVVVGTWE